MKFGSKVFILQTDTPKNCPIGNFWSTTIDANHLIKAKSKGTTEHRSLNISIILNPKKQTASFQNNI